MRDLILVLIGLCGGIMLGIGIMFQLMGKKLQDQFLGINQKNKPIVIDWIDGHTKDIHVMMRGVLVFTGVIRTMTLGRSTNSSDQLQIDIVAKSEVMREFRY